MVSATIKDAKVRKISELWRRRPLGLSFAVTDAVIMDLETEDGKKLRDTFYICMQADGTLSPATISKKKGTRVRQGKIASFLKKYDITEDIGDFSFTEDIEELKGKEVEVVMHDDGGHIRVP